MTGHGLLGHVLAGQEVADLTVIPYVLAVAVFVGFVAAARRFWSRGDLSGVASVVHVLKGALSATVMSVIVALAVGGAVTAVGTVSGSWRNVSILSDSMAPAIDKGDIAVVANRPLSELTVGDVIVFNAPETAGIVREGEPVIHRIIEIVPPEELNRTQPDAIYLRTQGDNNEQADRWIVEIASDAWVQVATVRDVGGVLTLFARPSARAGLLFAAALMLVGTAVAELIGRPDPDERDEPDEPDGLNSLDDLDDLDDSGKLEGDDTGGTPPGTPPDTAPEVTPEVTEAQPASV